MHVNIGPYLTWWGPYQLADLLQKVGVSEDRCFKIGEWLANTWVNNVCEFIHKRRHRREEVQIDDYDTWDLGVTLAIINSKALKKFKDMKASIPCTDRSDAPHILANDEEGYSTDRWNYIVDEMIFAFDHLKNDDWEIELWDNWSEDNMVKHNEIRDRIKNGLRLFSKYYESLWW